MNYQKVYMNHIHSSSLLCQLSQMWRSQLLCDALICTGNVVTKAHRVVLLAACPMLQSMENASIGTELEVRLAADIKQEAVNTFLQYLYEGFMLLTEDNVKHVEKVARLLQVDSVIKCCSDFFKCLEKSTGKSHNHNYKFDKYDLLEFRHVRATGLTKTYHDRLMKRMSESSRPTSPTGGKRQRLHRPTTPPSDNYSSQRADDAASMTQSYMGVMSSGAGSVRSAASSQSSRSDSPAVVEIIEDSIELVQREKPQPGQPEPSRLSQQKTSISVASHVTNAKDTRVVSIADDGGGGRTRTTDSFSDRVPNIPSSPQQSSQMSPKISFRDSHQQNVNHPSPTSFGSRIPSNQSFNTSQPPPPPLQQAGTLNIAPLSQSFSQGIQPRPSQDQLTSQSRPSQLSTEMFNDNVKLLQDFITSTPQRSHPTFPPSGARPSFAAGSATQAASISSQSPSSSQPRPQQDISVLGMTEKGEKREGESSRPPEGHDPGPSESSNDTADLSIVKIEKVGEDETGGLLMQVEGGQGEGQRTGQFMDDEQEYDESDFTGDWSQEDMSNEGSMHMPHEGDPSGGGAMYMGSTSEIKEIMLDETEVLEGSFVKASSEPEKSFACKVCDLSFKDKYSFQRHEKTHDSTQATKRCSICNVYFSSKAERDDHFEVKHKPLMCHVCGKEYQSKSVLNSHIMSMHTEDQDYDNNQKKIKICPFECCQKRFTRITFYQDHLNSHDGCAPYSCTRCSKTFYSRYSLNQHTKVCVDPEMFCCDICKKSFTRKFNLECHMSAAHSSKTFTCCCGKQFKFETNLTRHRKTKGHMNIYN